MLQKIVKTNRFTSVEEMKSRITYLEKLKEEQEDKLKFDLIDIYKSLQPAELVKSAIDNIREDVEVGEKAGGLAGSLGLNYIVSRLTGKNKGPVGYLKGLVIQQVVNYIYKKNERTINHFVGDLTRKALRKIHVLEDEEPKELALEENAIELKELEKEEDEELEEAFDENEQEKKEEEENEPTKNKTLTDPTPGPQKSGEK